MLHLLTQGYGFFKAFFLFFFSFLFLCSLVLWRYDPNRNETI